MKKRLTKRQKLVASVLLLSFGLFFSESALGRGGIILALVLSVASSAAFYFVVLDDVKGNTTPQLFILPFFYTLSLSLFYFLVPARFLTRVGITALYGVGLYSLFLSQNIFVVASIRTIQLLSGARIVSFVVTLVAYFFLTRVTFSLALPHVFAYTLRPLLVFVFSLLLTLQSIWTVTLDGQVKKHLPWATLLSVCLLEVALVLSFWPTEPTFIALFLTGIFYITLGLSHVWFAKRLFKGVLWEYAWVAAIVFSLLMLSTSWRG